MTLKPDYTARDQNSFLERSITSLRTQFPDWSDERLASFGNMVLSITAEGVDGNSFYIDKTTQQSRMVTATLRDPVLQHATALGYDPKSNAAAEGQVLVVLESIPTAPIDILPSTVVFSTEGENPVDFRPTEAFTVDAGIDPPQFYVSVENAELVTDIFVSDGTQNQPFTMRQGPYIQNSAVVSAGGEPYDVRSSLLRSLPGDTHTRGKLTTNDRLRLVFGDGNQGKVPVGQITSSYKFGGGRVGIVEASTITSANVSAFSARDGSSYNVVSVTNPERTQNGDDRESIASIQERAPRSRQSASDRTVAHVDYINHAEAVSGVERAFLATHRNADLAPNQAILMIVPTGGGQPGASLSDRVLREVTIEKPNNPLTQVTVRGPTYLTVSFNATVHLVSGATGAVARAAVEATLKEFFEPKNPDGSNNTQILFGSEYADAGQEASIPFHQLLAAFQDIPSIFKVSEGSSAFLMNGNHADVDIGSFEFPVLGSITLFNASTGLEF
jgi:hypothetical protein